MSCCAVMLVKDELDIIGFTLDHLLGQVDHVLVADNMSDDGTFEYLTARAEGEPRLTVIVDEEPGYYQSMKTTTLALRAMREGYDWVLPCDADEFWYAPEGRVGDWLDALAPEKVVAFGGILDHVPTSLDPEEADPRLRYGWRLVDGTKWGKVAAKMHPEFVIDQGNHGVTVPRYLLPLGRADGLVVHHYSWRGEAQYIHKRRVGFRAYELAVGLRTDFGDHWKMFGPDVPDWRIAEHYRIWFHREKPEEDETVTYDPAPVAVLG